MNTEKSMPKRVHIFYNLSVSEGTFYSVCVENKEKKGLETLLVHDIEEGDEPIKKLIREFINYGCYIELDFFAKKYWGEYIIKYKKELSNARKAANKK